MVTQMLGKYSVHETLSKGSFSRVRYCVDTSTNIPHALRIIDRQKIEEVGLLESLRNEITIMKMFEHRSVVSVINMMASTNRVFLVLDVMMAGNMKIKLMNEQFLNEKDAFFYFLQLYSGVEYLHSMGVTHGNLRLENILLHTNGNLKITDFSMSTILDIQDADVAYGMNSMAEDKKELSSTVSTKSVTALSKMAFLKHSLQYIAPEIIDDCSEDTKKADLWSVGVILFAMTSGFLPFGGTLGEKSDTTSKSDDSMHSGVASPRDDEEDQSSSDETMDRIRECQKKPYPDSLSDSLKTLLDGMLTVDPDERYTLYDIKNSEWMENIPEGMEILLEKMEKDVPVRKSSKRKSKAQNNPVSPSFFDCLCQPYSAFVAPKRSSTGFDSPYDSEDYSLDSGNEEDEEDDSGQDVQAASADDSVQFRSSSSLSMSTDCLNLKDGSKDIHKNKDIGSNLDSESNSPLKLGLSRR